MDLASGAGAHPGLSNDVWAEVGQARGVELSARPLGSHPLGSGQLYLVSSLSEPLSLQ